MALDDIKGYMIGIILCICVIAGGAFIIGDVISDSPSLDTANDLGKFNSTLNKAAEITNSTDKIAESIDDIATDGVSARGWIDALFGSAFFGIKAIFSSLGFVGSMIAGVASLFGIPTVVVGLLSAIAVVVIGFAIWSAVTRN